MRRQGLGLTWPGRFLLQYIATADLFRLAEKDGEIKKAIALYLAEKAEDGTPRQREIAEKILKRNPLFRVQPLEVGILNWLGIKTPRQLKQLLN